MDVYWRERVLAMAYKMSCGIRFNMALNLTGIDLSCHDLYANNISIDKDIIGKEDLLVKQEDYKLVFVSSGETECLYIAFN